MIEFNIENVKQRLQRSISWYSNYWNSYCWKEVVDLTPDHSFDNRPIYENLEDDIKEKRISVIKAKDIPHYSCFGRFTYYYHRVKKAGVSRIIFTSRINRKINSYATNNHCWLTPEELTYWLETAKQESGLDYYFKIEATNDFYYVTFDFKSLNRVQMKYVLFWTRYIFEYPASLCALDAMLLKKEYPDETLNNLLTLVTYCHYTFGFHFYINREQCLTAGGKFLELEEFRRRLATKKYSRVFNIFGSVPQKIESVAYKEAEPLLLTIKKTKKFSGNSFFPDEWLEVPERFDYYRKMYDILKGYEIKYKKEEE